MTKREPKKNKLSDLSGFLSFPELDAQYFAEKAKEWGWELSEEEKKPPSGFWRKKYPCKKSKGQHAFKLVKPNYSFMGRYSDLTVDEYYAERDREDDKHGKDIKRHGWFSHWRHWECVHCGKRDTDSEERPQKKIRNNLYNNEQ